jgi:hypothetical protein
MKNVLLILAKDNYPDSNIITNIVPQGLPYIAGALQNAGYSVFGLNPNYIQMDEDVKCSLSAIIKQKTEESSCDYIDLGGLFAETISHKSGVKYIILPHNEKDVTSARLKEMNVKQEDILCIEL